MYKRWVVFHSRSGLVRKFSSPPGFDPRTFLPVSRSYTDYATRPTFILVLGSKWLAVRDACVRECHKKKLQHSLNTATAVTRFLLRVLQQFIILCDFRFSPRVTENCSLLCYYAASSGNFLRTFRDNLYKYVSNWNLEDVTDSLYRNVGNKSSLLTA
jgi:hypothetical protein